MPEVPTELIQQIEAFDREALSKEISAVDAIHQELLERFPLEHWPEMTLEEYALGQGDGNENFCYAIEFKADALGGIRGNVAAKHLIYKDNLGDWNYPEHLGSTEQEAWESIRAGFVEMFGYAQAREWDKIDRISVFGSAANMTKAKSLYVYFSYDIIPIFSPNHVLHYLNFLGHPSAEDVSGEVIRLNRELMKALRELPGTEGLTNHDLMRILYENFSPPTGQENKYALNTEQLDMLMERFKETMTDFVDFVSPGEKLLETELKSKHAVLDRFIAEGGREKLEELVDSGKGQDGVKWISKLISSSGIGIVSFQSWRVNFGETDIQASAVLQACLDVTSSPYERPTQLKPIFEAIKAQKLKPSWDTLSTVLWILRPEDYFPIKISYYRKLADELETPLPKGSPGQRSLKNLLSFGRVFYDALEDYKPQDWVDVQSFIWTVCPRENPQPSGYWVFQCNPKQFDLPGALNSTQPLNWTVNQHQDDIKKGDKVILWITGSKGGCYGLATVASDLYDEKDGFGDHKIDLSIDVNLADTPLPPKWTKEVPGLKGFKGGKQGTNLPATKTEYETMLHAAEIIQEKRKYWLYAPGPQAANWESNLKNGEMTIGWDGTDDLMAYTTRDSLKERVKEIKGAENPYNDTGALWEFSREMQPGDVVVVKKGKTTLIGYGIVKGGYEFDANRGSYRHVRKMDWKKKGIWETDIDRPIKTLTQITRYLDYVYQLKKLIGMDDMETDSVTLTAQNLILYGPPGTGKTYTLRNDWFPRYITKRDTMTKEQLAEEIAGGRTWWEVIAMVVLDLEKAKVVEILEHPLMKARILTASAKNPRASIWSALQIHTQLDCPNVKYENRMEPLLFNKNEKSVWTIDEALTKELVPELLESLDQWEKGPSSGKEEHRFAFTTFHQSYTYEDFIEGIKPVLAIDGAAGELGYELKDGVFKNIAKRARANPEKRYALFIDEINRGNVASIFGELITLIEPDKRAGMLQALAATLPYSREEFSVPGNLDIIATMNTADRSVEALDTALRRRFEFKEMMPLPEVIEPQKVAGVELRKLLETINARIECLLDRDHLLGHSYLIGLQSLQDLREAFANKILPLLQEYFYHDPARIGMVLGGDFVERKTNGSGSVTFGKGSWDLDGLADRDLFVLKDPMTLGADAFKGIYEAETNS